MNGANQSGRDEMTIPELPRKKKNWLHVNIGEGEAKELRALAECMGMTLRGFLLGAVGKAKRAAAKELGVKSWDAIKIDRRRRKEMATARREFDRKIDCLRPVTN